METEKKKRTLFYSIVTVIYFIIAKLFFFIHFEGRENIPADKPIILMSNHVSLLDPLTLGICVRDREIHFMGKKELFENKFLGWCLTRLHAFPVDRGNSDIAAIRTSLNIIKAGDSLGIFPEGTRSKTGYMGPLLGGASLLALKSGCDVLPVYIDGPYRIFRPLRVIVGKTIEMQDLRVGRVNKETCDILTHRMEGVFAHLSGGKALAPGKTAEKQE
ncbi:MAG: 1-acyl-sn-glycerol-3-phosphate acyltransferase [Clostridia bacterium]|nr:1-acyl-sn-glycerol-3-phosphate acyltransferase [Clostridia bacterium]